MAVRLINLYYIRCAVFTAFGTMHSFIPQAFCHEMRYADEHELDPTYILMLRLSR
jgi:hypothetical protein